GDAAQAYVARSHKGHWFVWEESSEPPGDGKPKVFSGPNSQNGHHQASGARARSDGGWRMMGLPDPSGAMPMPADKTPDQDRRTTAVLIHLTPGEWEKIERAARLSGRTAETFVRSAALAAAGT